MTQRIQPMGVLHMKKTWWPCVPSHQIGRCQQVGLGRLLAIMSWPVFQTIFDWGSDIFAKYQTQVTQGSQLDDSIQAYQEKKALETRQQGADCNLQE
jgi:hypothetical protein